MAAATKQHTDIERKPQLELDLGEHVSKWSEIKIEAERAEDFQRGLSLLPSLKIYRAVSQHLWQIMQMGELMVIM